MSTKIKPILDALDLTRLGQELDVKERSFRLARERGVFPAAWYPTVKRHCEEAGVSCPMDAFNWKSPSLEADGSPACSDEMVNASDDCKGDAA